MGYQEDFISAFSEHIHRDGAEALLAWMQTTYVFTAPASTRFHGACEGGLVMHSLNVYQVLCSRFYTEGENPESYAICGLLHDLCKANFYKPGFRNVKNDETNTWERVPTYSVADEMCIRDRSGPVRGHRRCPGWRRNNPRRRWAPGNWPQCPAPPARRR